MSTSVLQDFALDVPSLSLMASLQYRLIERDIKATESSKWFGDNAGELKALKRKWRDEWKKKVLDGFKEMETTEEPTLWYSDTQDYKAQLQKLKQSKDRLPAGLILLELAAWDAYWPFREDQKDFKDAKLDNEGFEAFLSEASKMLGFGEDRAEELRDALKSAQKGLTGYWWKLAVGVAAGLGIGALTLGLAAPFIAGAIGGAMGLGGAAATSAGLAALGGGAIAAGGFGMAGGTAVLVGGGAVLGMGAGGAAGRLASSIAAESVLLSSAKLEVVIKEFILQGQRDTAKLQEILIAQRKSIQALETELDELRMSGKKSDERAKQLEKSVDVMRKSLARNQSLAA